MPDIPVRVLSYIAGQVRVPATALADYGQRENTLYEHLDEIRAHFGFRNYGWREMRAAMAALLKVAMESDRIIPLIEAALDYLRQHKIIAPGMTTIERLVWRVRRRSERRVERLLTAPLTDAHRAALNGLLQATGSQGRTRRTTRLAWLRIPAGNPSPSALSHVLARLTFLQQLAVPPPPVSLHRNRVVQLARRCSRTQAQPLADMDEPRRYAFLVAYLWEQYQECIDQLLDLADDVLGDLLRKGERKQDLHIAMHAQTMNTQLHVLTAVAEAFLRAEADGLDPYATVYGVIPKTLLQATVQDARALARPVDFDYLDLIEPKYLKMRQPLLAFYRALTFLPYRQRDPAILALEHIRRLENRKERVRAIRQTIGTTTYIAPLAHLTARWRPHVLSGTTINPNYYEAAAFDRLKAALRSGDIAVADSRRYQPFDSYLLPKAQWIKALAIGDTRLAYTADAQTYLAERTQEIHQHLIALQGELGPTSGLTIDDMGQFHLSSLEALVPPEAKAFSRSLYRLVPRLDLADMLREVNRWTHFLDCCTHQTTGLPLPEDEAMPLLAAIMATGLNLGLTTMAGACSFTYRQMSWASDWYLREDTLLRGLEVLDNFVLHQPLALSFGDGTRSSSDGLRIRLAVQAANAERNAEYFDDGWGLTIYLHLADVGPPFRQRVISPNDSEAWYVIDALCNHETEFDLKEHFTDSAGSSEHVFGACLFLGFRFSPRIADMLGQQLWTIGKREDYGVLNPLLKGRIASRPIIEHWDGVQRMIASIRHGTVPASILMRKLAAYPRQHHLAVTLAEIGKIERTCHLLECLRSEAKRRTMEVRLNRHESVNALGRALFFGRHGLGHDRAFQEQMHRASCLVLVMAAITAWNTVYLNKALHTLGQRGMTITPELLQHVAPWGWEHINLLGRYHFDQPTWTLEHLRPLRREADIALAEAPAE